MLWAYYLSTIWEDHSVKSNWRDFYVYCMEEKRDVNSPSHDIDITSYPEALCLYGRDLKIEKGLQEKGYFVDKENTEIIIPDDFNYLEALDALKIAIREIFDDDNPTLIPGEEEDFAGTNIDSIATMMAKDCLEKIKKAAEKETNGNIKKYIESHPENFISYVPDNS